MKINFINAYQIAFMKLNWIHEFSICSIIRLEIRWRTYAGYCFNTSCVLPQVAKWNTANDYDVDETREHVLLAQKSEIRKLLAKKQQDGITLVPTAIIYRNGKIIVIVGICKGKNNYDKRYSLKEKQAKRDIARSVKQY